MEHEIQGLLYLGFFLIGFCVLLLGAAVIMEIVAEVAANRKGDTIPYGWRWNRRNHR